MYFRRKKPVVKGEHKIDYIHRKDAPAYRPRSRPRAGQAGRSQRGREKIDFHGG
jgi:hypothetical protein